MRYRAHIYLVLKETLIEIHEWIHKSYLESFLSDFSFSSIFPSKFFFFRNYSYQIAIFWIEIIEKDDEFTLALLSYESILKVGGSARTLYHFAVFFSV